MSAVARFADKCSGHGCFPSRPNIGASGNVFVNGKGVQRLGDPYASHCCPNHGCHDGVVSAGNGHVFVNGRPLARIGDQVSCGSVIEEGSGNVFCN